MPGAEAALAKKVLLGLLVVAATTMTTAGMTEEKAEGATPADLLLVKALARKAANESALSKFLREPQLGTSWYE